MRQNNPFYTTLFMTREIKTDKKIENVSLGNLGFTKIGKDEEKFYFKLTFIKSLNGHKRDQIISRIYLSMCLKYKHRSCH